MSEPTRPFSAPDEPTPDPELSPPKLTAGANSVNLRIQAERRRLDAARGTSPTVGFAFDAFSYDTDTGAPVLAAALGFRVFLFQVPYMCLFVIIAGFVADVTGRSIESMFKGKGIASLTAQSVQSAASLSGWARFTGFVVVAYALFLSARAFVKVLNIVHSLVWDVPRTKLHRTRTGQRSASSASSLSRSRCRTSSKRCAPRSAVGGVAALILFTIVPFLAWWYVSWWLPHRDCPPIALAPGAALVAIGIEILHVVTVIWFPHHLQSKSEIYGTIGLSVRAPAVGLSHRPTHHARGRAERCALDTFRRRLDAPGPTPTTVVEGSP